jgi:hypothetical protein
LVSAVSQVTDERAITAISLVHPSRRSGISSIDGNLSLDTQRNTNSQDGQQWCNHVKANQRQAFKPHFTFPSIHLFLTSLSSHHTSQRAIPPSDAWRPRARSQHEVTCTSQRNNSSHTKPKPRIFSHPSTHSHTTHPRSSHSEYHPPPSRHHVATCEAQAHRR